MKEQLGCARCGGKLQEGVLMGIHAAPLSWAEGEPEFGVFGRVKVDEKREFKVSTFRCVVCGHLESFAREESDWLPRRD